jgi:segregation and condensation protein B
MALEHKIEAVLFYKGEPETKSRLAALLAVSVEEIEEAANMLSTSLSTRGIRLLKIDDQYELVTAPETSEEINNAKKEEMVRDLGKAGSETLAIVLYHGPVSRADIDYIRGVNCAFILRNLQIRGLVKRIQNPENSRSFLYQATPELLKHLGVAEVTDLPDYAELKKQIDAFESEKIVEEESDTTNAHE